MKLTQMKLTRIAIDAFFAACHEWACDSHIDIVDATSLEDDIFTVKVNWAAIGSVDADRTLDFADDLRTAARIAGAINANGYKIIWDSSVRNADLNDRGAYLNAAAYLYESFTECAPSRIVRWLDEHCID